MIKKLICTAITLSLIATAFIGCAEATPAAPETLPAPSPQEAPEVPGEAESANEANGISPLTDAERIVAIIGDRVIPPLSEASQGRVVHYGFYNCDHMTAAPTGYDSGLFEALGLNVSITGHGRVPESMAAAQMDMGLVDYRVTLAGRRAGSPLFVAAENHTGGSVFLVVSHDIREPQDLIGSRFALGNDPLNNLTWVEWAGILGIPADPSYYENFIMSDADEYFTFVLGELDAFIACDPWASMAIYEGTGWIMKSIDTDRSDIGLGHGTCCKVVMHQDFAAQYPDLAERMLLAHSMSIQFMYLFPNRSAEIFADTFNVPHEVGLMTLWKKLNYEGRTIRWDLNIDYFQNEINAMRYFGVRDDINDAYVRDYIDLTFFNNSGADDFETFIREQVDPVFPLGMTFEEWRERALEVDRIN